MNQNLSSSLRQSGLSLMELMIAITIGFVVVAGVGYVYVSSRQTFRTQNSMSAIQENSRFALDTMSKDIRMAGYMGCGNFSSIGINSIATNPVVNIPTGGLQVFPGGALPWAAPAGVARVAGDVLRVALAEAASGVTLTGNMMTTSASLQITGNPSNYKAGDVLMVADCKNADVFVATTVSNASGMVTIAHGSNSNTNPPFLSKLYGTSPPPPALVYTFRQIDYFIGCPTVSWTALSNSCSVPIALYQVINGAAQPLVDNVENMYFSLGVDTAPPAKVVLGAYQTPAVVAAASNWANVLTVQIHLLMVGGPANDTGSNVAVVPQTYTFNGATPATPDRRMRQEAIASVGLRNHLP